MTGPFSVTVTETGPDDVQVKIYSKKTTVREMRLMFGRTFRVGTQRSEQVIDEELRKTFKFRRVGQWDNSQRDVMEATIVPL